MILPLLALCTLAVLQLVSLTRDALAVQEAARVGARLAATTTDDVAVTQAVAGVVGWLRFQTAQVEVSPSDRSHGDTITVEVTMFSRFGPFRPQVRGRAVVRGEPILGPP